MTICFSHNKKSTAVSYPLDELQIFADNLKVGVLTTKFQTKLKRTVIYWPRILQIMRALRYTQKAKAKSHDRSKNSSKRARKEKKYNDIERTVLKGHEKKKSITILICLKPVQSST